MQKPRHVFLYLGLLFSVLGLLLFSCSSITPIAAATPMDKYIRDSAVNDLFLTATQEVMLGQYDSAIVHYRRVLDLQPENAAALYQLSRLYWSKSELKKAIAAIEIAFRLDPDNQWVLNQYAVLMDINGENEKAASLFGRLAAETDQDEEYLMKQAFSLEKAGKSQQALTIFNQLKQFLGDDNEELLLQRQKLFLKENQLDSAIAEGRKLVGYYPEQPEYLLLLANLYTNYDDPAKGYALFKKADQLFPKEEKVQAALVRYYLIYEPDSLKSYLNDIILERDMSTMEKIDILRMVKSAPRHDSLFHKLSNQYIQALARQHPDDAKAALFYGMVLNLEGALDSAAHQFKRVLSLHPDNYIAWQQLFMLEAKQNAMDSLISSTEKAAVFFPKDPIIDYFRGYAFLRKDNAAKAIPVLENGLSKLAPDDTSLLLQFHTFLGDAYQKQADSSKVIFHYEHALLLAPDNLSVLNNYSYYLAEMGIRLKEAERMSAQTIAARPNEATFLDTYGWILYQKGRYKDAKVYLEKALQKMAPEDDKSATLEHLGDVEYRLGSPQRALEKWKAAQLAGGNSKALLKKIDTQKLTK